jgi:hypothetical protein
MARHAGSAMLVGTLFIGLLVFGCAGQGGQAGTNATAVSGTGSVAGFTFSDNLGTAISALPAAYSNEYYEASIVPTSGTPPFTCDLVQGSGLPGSIQFFPQGCVLAGDAPMLSGRTTKGEYPFKFTIADSKGKKSGPFDLTLVVTNRPPEVSAPFGGLEARALENFSFNFCDPVSESPLYCGKGGEDQLYVFNGVPPYRFSGTGQPLGLTMRSDGLLSGVIPDGATLGEQTMNICVADSTGTEGCVDANITVLPNLITVKSAECKIVKVIEPDREGNPGDDLLALEIKVTGTAYGPHPDSMFMIPDIGWSTVYLDTYMGQGRVPASYLAMQKLTCPGWETVTVVDENSFGDTIYEKDQDSTLYCRRSGTTDRIEWTYTHSVVQYRGELEWGLGSHVDAGRESFLDMELFFIGGDPEGQSIDFDMNCS